MSNCPSCSAENSEKSKYCSECGAALSPEYEPTEVPPSTDSSQSFSSASSSHHGRFLPGVKVADRYRIVSLLGKGGMGEVYRADDLKLGHTVALKFLPKDLANEPQRLEYFLNEVRLTRQVSHPNVCRVYDIGEVEGQHFLSMEYIDGEDLKVLLRRIGRLPHDKGVQIAQQLCAGLEAAHDKGVLHRDLKPANIMIDGRGQVRITDFGLAKLVDEGVEGEIAGTPAYMAPEQLAQGQTSIQSDLYSLGLILYEVFTGETVHKSASVQDRLSGGGESSPSHPSALVEDIDPVVERVILRCLERNVDQRPKSARAVATSLPGGDPLAAALAAGETPSPEMVAAAGEVGSLSLRSGLLLLSSVLMGLVVLMFLSPLMQPTAAPDAIPPVDLRRDVQVSILTPFGYYDDNDKPAHVIHGLQLNPEGDRDWEFWYRQRIDSYLTPTIKEITFGPKTYAISMSNPPMGAGMVSVRTDLKGHLIELLAAADGASQPNDEKWRSDLFSLAGLSYGDFIPVEEAEKLSSDLPPVYCDDVAVFHKTNDSSVRVIVGRNNDQLVYFYADPVDDSRVANRQFVPLDISVEKGVRSYHQLLQLIVLLPSIFLALRNIRLGRADRRGALCFALWLGGLEILIWLFGLHHVSSPMREWVLLRDFLREPWLAYSFRHWLYYMALEPYIRRYWPDVLIGWSRAVKGRFRDPLLGKQILIGSLNGVLVWVLCSGVYASLASLTGHTEPFEIQFDVNSPLRPVTTVLYVLSLCASNAVFALMLLFLLRILLRDTRLAIAGYAILNTTVFALDDRPETVLVVIALWCVGLGLTMTRFGLMSSIAFIFPQALLEVFPVTTELNSWYGGGTLVALVSILVVASFSFYTCTLAFRIPSRVKDMNSL